MAWKNPAKDQFSSRESRRAEQYPGSGSYEALDQRQNPRTFEYDRLDVARPGVTVGYDWEYFKVPFLEQDEDCWNDINFEGSGLKTGASAPDYVAVLPSGGIYLYGFDGGASVESVHGGGEILHDYKEGSDLYVHVHWMPTTAGAGNVRWYFEYAIAPVGGTFGAPSTIYGETDTGTAAWDHILTSIATIDGAGITIGSHLLFRLYRDPGDDTYAADAALMSVGVHYLIDTLGSKTISAK